MYHTHQGQTPLRRLDSTGRSSRVRQEPVQDERAEAAPRLGGRRTEVGQRSFDVEEREGIDQSEHGGVTTPFPLLRLLYEPRPHWVERDVPMHLGRMALAFDEDGAVSRLEEMPTLSSVPVRPLAVPTVEVLHPRSDVGPRRSHEEVKVGREQAIASAGPAKAGDGRPEEREEPLPFSVVAKHQAADVGMSRDVVETAGELDAVGTRHDGDDRREQARPSGPSQFCDEGVRGQTLERGVSYAGQDQAGDEERDDESVDGERGVVPPPHVAQ